MCASLGWPVSRPERGMSPPVLVPCKRSKGCTGAGLGVCCGVRMGTTRLCVEAEDISQSLAEPIVEDRKVRLIEVEGATAFRGDPGRRPGRVGSDGNYNAGEFGQAGEPVAHQRMELCLIGFVFAGLEQSKVQPLPQRNTCDACSRS